MACFEIGEEPGVGRLPAQEFLRVFAGGRIVDGDERTEEAEVFARLLGADGGDRQVQVARLTERTFFRHFADKREVLFWGSGALKEFLVSRVEAAPASLPPIEAIAGALVEAAAVLFEERRAFARERQAVIAANAELQERERIKLASLATALAEALRRRGVADPSASLAAESGIAVFRVAFERWVAETGERTLSQIIRETVNELKAVTLGQSPATRR